MKRGGRMQGAPAKGYPMTFAQIAEVMGCSESNVHHLYRSAMYKLKLRRALVSQMLDDLDFWRNMMRGGGA